jgi:sodium/hydrogen antiporter
MKALLVYAVLLLASSLLSHRAARSAFSSTALFLVGGFAASAVGLLPSADADWIKTSAEVALFAVLFTDGMRLSAAQLRSAWRLPGRALLLGMPLSVLLLALAAHFLVGLAWPQAFLVGAVLGPTDPVFASALVGRDAVPEPLRRLLNIESGLNDGLALPVVLALLAWLGTEREQPVSLLSEVAGGAAVGIVLPWAVAHLRGRVPRALPQPHPSLFIVSVGLLLFASTRVAGLNPYLAAFVGGIVLASCVAEDAKGFEPVGASADELLKFAALLAFAGTLGVEGLGQTQGREIAFGLVALLLARPLAILLVLVGSSLGWRERLAAAWFGPKGFASIVYAVLVLQSGIPQAAQAFHLCAVVVLMSMLAHSSTDVAIAAWFQRRKDASGARGESPDGPRREPPG